MPIEPTIHRVALVSPYDFAQAGGVTEHVRQLAKHLRLRDIDVTIIAPASSPVVDEPRLMSIGPITSVPINGSVARPTLSPVVLDEVASLLANEHFDVIHIHEPFVPMLPIAVLNASPWPNVGTFHASGERSIPYAASRKLVHWLAQRLTLRIAVSEQAAQFIKRYIDGEYQVIPNGVDIQRFRPDLEPLPQWSDGRPNILFVGRFDEPRKGLGVLLDAWPFVQHARPDARLLIVGRGDPHPYRQRILDLGVHNVYFLGAASDEELPRYYAMADIFCAPSTGQESFGIVLVEAMSCGTPVVASDIGGYRQVLSHRREGLLVPPQQPHALATALLHLLDDPGLRRTLGNTGRETAQHYAWEGIADRVIDTYKQAVVLHQQAQLHADIQMAPHSAEFFDLAASADSYAIANSDTMSQIGDETLETSSQSDVQPVAQPAGEEPMLTKPFEERVRALTQQVAGRILGRSGISPNMLTAAGFVLTLIVPIVLAEGYFVWGGILVLVTSAFDMLDGALARATGQKSSFGAFFDSTVDRYTEAIILLGLLMYYDRLPGVRWEVALIYLSIVGSLMVSYTRARAESLGFDCKVGLLARPERIILLSIGLLVGWVSFALAILAIFTNVTAIQRVFHVWRQDRARKPQAAVSEEAPRSRLLPRGERPS